MKMLNHIMIKVEDYLGDRENRRKVIDFIERFVVIGGILVTLILIGASLMKE